MRAGYISDGLILDRHLPKKLPCLRRDPILDSVLNFQDPIDRQLGRVGSG